MNDKNQKGKIVNIDIFFEINFDLLFSDIILIDVQSSFLILIKIYFSIKLISKLIYILPNIYIFYFNNLFNYYFIENNKPFI